MGSSSLIFWGLGFNINGRGYMGSDSLIFRGLGFHLLQG